MRVQLQRHILCYFFNVILEHTPYRNGRTKKIVNGEEGEEEGVGGRSSVGKGNIDKLERGIKYRFYSYLSILYGNIVNYKGRRC